MIGTIWKPGIALEKLASHGNLYRKRGEKNMAPEGKKGPCLVLYQPEIPGNTGTLMRLAACWGRSLHLIGPLGFVWSDRHLKRAGMDYAQCVACPVHASWSEYLGAQTSPHRKIAVVPHADISYIDFSFTPTDHLIMGSESCGLPLSIERACDAGIYIPMIPGVRSLNLALSSSIVWAEAMRQTHSFSDMSKQTP